MLLNTGGSVTPTLEPNSYMRDAAPTLRLRNLPVEMLQGEIPVFKLTLTVPLDQARKGDSPAAADLPNYAELQI